MMIRQKIYLINRISPPCLQRNHHTLSYYQSIETPPPPPLETTLRRIHICIKMLNNLEK